MAHLQPCITHPCANCTQNETRQPNIPRLTCKGCRAVFYCNEVCQKQHWFDVHKMQCATMRKYATCIKNMRIRSGLTVCDLAVLHPCPFALTPLGVSVAKEQEHLPLKDRPLIQYRPWDGKSRTLTWTECPERTTHSLITFRDVERVVEYMHQNNITSVCDYAAGIGLVTAMFSTVDPDLQIWASDIRPDREHEYHSIKQVDLTNDDLHHINSKSLVVIAWADNVNEYPVSLAHILSQAAYDREATVLHLDASDSGVATQEVALAFMRSHFHVVAEFKPITINMLKLAIRQDLFKTSSRVLRELLEPAFTLQITGRLLRPVNPT